MNPRGDGIAVAGIADRRLQQLRQWLATVVGGQPVPGVDSAGNDDAVGGAAGDLGDALFLIPFNRGRSRGAAGAVIGNDISRIPGFAAGRIQAEAIAARSTAELTVACPPVDS